MNYWYGPMLFRLVNDCLEVQNIFMSRTAQQPVPRALFVSRVRALAGHAPAIAKIRSLEKAFIPSKLGGGSLQRLTVVP